jgi:hypothetical protein
MTKDNSKEFEELKADFELFRTMSSTRISDLVTKTKNDSGRIDSLQKDVFCLSNGISALQKSNEVVLNILNTLQDRFTILQEKGLENTKNIRSLRSDFDNICFANQMLKISYEDLTRESNSNAELLKKDIDDINICLENLGVNIESRFQTSKESVDYVRNQSNFINKEIINLKETICENNKINLEAINKCVSDFDFMRSYVETKFDRISHEIEVIHQDFDGVNECLNKKDDQDTDNGSLDIVNDLKKTIESLKLDVQNSHLRTSNNSTQIQMIDKRIENIFLQLKKIELEKA